MCASHRLKPLATYAYSCKGSTQVPCSAPPQLPLQEQIMQEIFLESELKCQSNDAYRQYYIGKSPVRALGQ